MLIPEGLASAPQAPASHLYFQEIEGQIEQLIEQKHLIEQAIAPAVTPPSDDEEAKPQELPENEMHRLLMRMQTVNEMYRDLHRRIKF